MNYLWDVIFNQETGQEGLRSFSVLVSVRTNVEHEAVLVLGTAQARPATYRSTALSLGAVTPASPNSVGTQVGLHGETPAAS
jgi:hypothetical protein